MGKAREDFALGPFAAALLGACSDEETSVATHVSTDPGFSMDAGSANASTISADAATTLVSPVDDDGAGTADASVDGTSPAAVPSLPASASSTADVPAAFPQVEAGVGAPTPDEPPSSDLDAGIDLAPTPSATAPVTPPIGPVALPDAGVSDAGAPSSEVPPPCAAEPGVWGGALPASTNPSSTAFEGCAALEWLGRNVVVRDVSGDGSTLVGNRGPLDAYGSGGAAFRWRRGQSIEWLAEGLRAEAVNDDGDWIAGTAVDDEGVTSAVRIGPDGDIEVIAAQGSAKAISSNGDAIVGNGRAERVEQTWLGGPYRWSVEQGFEELPAWGEYNGNPLEFAVQDTNGDASIVLGAASSPQPDSPVALWWTEAGGIEFADAVQLNAVSADGSLVVGNGGGARGPAIASAWFVETGESLDLALPEAIAMSSTATLVNADGSVVIIEGRIPGEDYASHLKTHVWQQGAGTRDLTDLLANSCVDGATPLPEGEWKVPGLSADARLLIGCSDFGDEACCWAAGWE